MLKPFTQKIGEQLDELLNEKLNSCLDCHVSFLPQENALLIHTKFDNEVHNFYFEKELIYENSNEKLANIIIDALQKVVLSKYFKGV